MDKVAAKTITTAVVTDMTAVENLAKRNAAVFVYHLEFAVNKAAIIVVITAVDQETTVVLIIMAATNTVPLTVATTVMRMIAINGKSKLLV